MRISVSLLVTMLFKLILYAESKKIKVKNEHWLKKVLSVK